MSSAPSAPQVTVVIPTRFRPELVTRAVGSVLAQTFTDFEVVVVVDGPDDDTRASLDQLGDDRLRVIVLPEKGGAPNARNVGAGAARGRWTALLDDDDEWLPDKLTVQLKLAGEATAVTPVVATRLLNRTPRAEYVLPRRLPADGEPLSEYFTVRRGLFHGEGFIQTSTILAPTELFARVPFTVGLRRQQELDWTLRAVRHDDVQLIVAPDQPRDALGGPARLAAAQPGPVHPAGVRGLHDERAQLDGRAHPQRHRVPRDPPRGPRVRPARPHRLRDLPADLGAATRAAAPAPGPDPGTSCRLTPPAAQD
jgi:hypothetical protein